MVVPMVVGVLRLSLFLADNASLKGKRSVVRSLLGRVRAKFNIAAAEVGTLDAHQHATLGFAAVSNNPRHAQAMLDKLLRFCEQHAAAEVSAVTTEIVSMGAPVGELRSAGESLDLPLSWTEDGLSK